MIWVEKDMDGWIELDMDGWKGYGWLDWVGYGSGSLLVLFLISYGRLCPGCKGYTLCLQLFF